MGVRHYLSGRLRPPVGTSPARSSFTGADTVVFGNPQVGDWVSFEGHLHADGTRYADRIVLLNHSPENQFTFIGKVESIGDTAWTISGRVVQVNEFTEIEPDSRWVIPSRSRAVSRQMEVSWRSASQPDGRRRYKFPVCRNYNQHGQGRLDHLWHQGHGRREYHAHMAISWSAILWQRKG